MYHGYLFNTRKILEFPINFLRRRIAIYLDIPLIKNDITYRIASQDFLAEIIVQDYKYELINWLKFANWCLWNVILLSLIVRLLFLIWILVVFCLLYSTILYYLAPRPKYDLIVVNACITVTKILTSIVLIVAILTWKLGHNRAVNVPHFVTMSYRRLKYRFRWLHSGATKWQSLVNHSATNYSHTFLSGWVATVTLLAVLTSQWRRID